ncbi:single-stranded DNA-binding protein [Thalassotalea atypica]|uniref:single-stranded DNA-binding protein n=1 Tax=Thalassotalea atypica TaxID=2054316 RepID=UPI0025743F67|nr:single-stranded DNA-binding protein [Thalassotalea atypica]
MTSFEEHNQQCAVTLLGNLVAKPEIRYLANPVLAVTDITLATTHKWLDKKSGATKEWTSYHNIKAVGRIVESALQQANKGDVIFVQGYIANNKQQPLEIVHATAIEHFAKSYTNAINQVICSATICSNVQLITTEHNKQMATFDVTISHQVYSEHKQKLVTHQISRPVHVWGKQALYVHKNAAFDQSIIIEGKLAYANNNTRSQFLEAIQVHLLKK